MLSTLHIYTTVVLVNRKINITFLMILILYRFIVMYGRANSGNEVGQVSSCGSCAAKSEWKTALSPPSATLQCKPDRSSPDCNNHSNAVGRWSLQRGTRVMHSSFTTLPAIHSSGKVSNTPARATCHHGSTVTGVRIDHLFKKWG